MLQWFIRFPEFAEFTEFLFHLGKTQVISIASFTPSVSSDSWKRLHTDSKSSTLLSTLTLKLYVNGPLGSKQIDSINKYIPVKLKQVDARMWY